MNTPPTLRAALTACLALLWSTSPAWSAPPLRNKTDAEIQREVALRIKAKVLSNKLSVNEATKTQTRVVVLKVLQVFANRTAFKAALKPGQQLRFEKTCQLGNPDAAKGELPRHCKGRWAAVPGAFKQAKDSTVKIPLRILRSASRVVFATISPTVPETRVIKGTVVLK